MPRRSALEDAVPLVLRLHRERRRAEEIAAELRKRGFRATTDNVRYLIRRAKSQTAPAPVEHEGPDWPPLMGLGGSRAYNDFHAAVVVHDAAGCSPGSPCAKREECPARTVSEFGQEAWSHWPPRPDSAA